MIFVTELIALRVPRLIYSFVSGVAVGAVGWVGIVEVGFRRLANKSL